MPENPQIQQLLAALPEMFPGVQKIPLANIRLNPNNPGAKAAEEDIAELAANIALVGLKNAAKVMPDPAGPLAPDLSPHPDNFRLKADNTPWSLSDFRFLNLSGELRQLACQRLQWTVMDGLILNPTPEEAVEITDLDNAVRDKGWWAKYQSVEALIKANSNLKQREIATRLKTNVKRVNWAISLLPLLNTEARGVLVSNGNKSNKGKDAISEISASHLADLGPGSAFKPGGTANNPPQTLYPYPPIPPETQDLVYRTLVVARDHQMKEAQVQKLVEHVQAGNPPETFGSAPKEPKAKKAPGITPEALAKAVELAEQVGVAKGRGEDPKPTQDLLDAHLASVQRPQAEEHALSVPIPPEQGIGAEIKTASSGQVPQSFKVTSPEGFNLLKQKVGDIAKAFKSGSSNTGISTPLGSQPVHAGQTTHHTTAQGQKEIKPLVHWFDHVAHWFVKIVWHWFIKNEHKVCKKLAHAIVPLHSSPSSRTHSGHSHNRSNSLSQGLMTLSLTILHGVVYTLLQFVVLWSAAMWFTSHWLTWLKPWIEIPFRFTARLALVDFPDWAWTWAWGHVVPAIVIAVLLFIGYSYAWKTQKARMTILGLCLFLFIYYGRKWSEVTVPNAESQPSTVVSAPSSQSTPIMDVVKNIVSISKPKEKPAPTSAPVVAANGNINGPLAQPSHVAQLVASQQVYQPAVSFAPPASPLQTLYDPKLLEQEIAALPKNCIVKSFPVLTDEGMPGDLAVSRMQGVTDPDKYTMMIGSGKQQIQSITTTTTNLIINYKSTDPFNMFNGPGQLNYFWEDVLYIHTDEIDVENKTPYTIYQLSLVVSGSKYALTIQCASVDDLKHLVSTMQYFIRNSRLGHDTALAGMPYPSQGLVLNNDCVVDKLWAESPMDAGSDMEPAQSNRVAHTDSSSESVQYNRGPQQMASAFGHAQQVKAGVTLGDHLWSIGKVTSEKQSRSDLEAGLKTLPVTFFAASPSEWTKALIARDPAQANSFRPRLRKVSLGQ